jgi:uncharacterized protein (TIGR03086 family)
MTVQELFIMSNQALQKVISQITDDKWDMEMPVGLSSKPSTLEEAVRYHMYDDAWVPDVLAGKTKEEVGDAYESLLSNDFALDTYNEYNERANEAVRQLTDLDRMTHLSYGEFPARDYLQHILTFRAFRSYDIAKMIGADTTMSDELVQGLTEELTPVVEGYRQMGVFPPAREVTADASPQEKLLALVGRE